MLLVFKDYHGLFIARIMRVLSLTAGGPRATECSGLVLSLSLYHILYMYIHIYIYILIYIYICYPPPKKPRFQQSSNGLFKIGIVIEICPYYILLYCLIELS